MHTKSKPSWRAILPVHPAADMFPMLSEPELRAVGKHIKKNGLQSPIVIGLKLGANYASSCADDYELWDGRNRLAALELVAGLEIPLTFIPRKNKGRWKSDPRWELKVAGHYTPTIEIKMPGDSVQLSTSQWQLRLDEDPIRHEDREEALPLRGTG